MSIIPRPSSPRAAWRDFRDFVGERRPHRWVFAAAAIGVTMLIVLAFHSTFNIKPEYKEPDIVYVQQWPANRTLAEVEAQQARDLPAEKAEQARIERLKAERRREFQRVAKMMGL